MQAQAWETHACPATQSGVGPQAHVPSAAQPSALDLSHGLQPPPTGPQKSTEVAVHDCPEQQPVWHEEESQRQLPLTQCWPATQASPPSHWQTPIDEQESASSVSQTTQASPPMPQLPSERGWQTSPSQQPEGQEVASHLQTPRTQCLPGSQGGFEFPQPQTPVALQVSVVTGSHTAQGSPLAPQAPGLGG